MVGGGGGVPAAEAEGAVHTGLILDASESVNVDLSNVRDGIE